MYANTKCKLQKLNTARTSRKTLRKHESTSFVAHSHKNEMLDNGRKLDRGFTTELDYFPVKHSATI